MSIPRSYENPGEEPALLDIPRSYENPGEEPALLDLLSDPVMHAVMRRDGVTLAELCAVIRAGRHRLGAESDAVVMLPPPVSWPDWRCPDAKGNFEMCLI
ncbi:MAG: hypothetical protein WDN69_37295 [Aliidongia sp.]